MTALGDAAALLDHFARSGWGSCHVRAAGLELFVARRAGFPNPMAGGAAAPAAPAPATATLDAPHLGTIATLAAVGETIAAGDTFATLDLLGETIPLASDRGGTVVERLAEIGTLAEFGQALVALR